MKRRLTLLTAAAMTWALAQSAAADLTRVELSDPARPAELRIEIEWGSIHIVGDGEASVVTIEAVADRPGEVAGSLIAVSEAANVVTVEQQPLRQGTFRSANLEITTPLATNLNLRMNRGGDIRVDGVRGLVEVTNLNGSVELDGVSGAAAVNASNGSIRAAFVDVDPGRDMIFASLNGSVELCLPTDVSGRVHLSTAGDPILSDFPIEREAQVAVVGPGGSLAAERSEVKGRIGPGEVLLRASTLNGDIQLRRCE